MSQVPTDRHGKCATDQVFGRWREGYALDIQTTSSDFLGYDEYGNPQFDTKRSPLGELPYKLKYRSDTSVIDEIVEALGSFVAQWNPTVDVIVPVPASRARAVQPVLLLAQSLCEKLGLALGTESVRKVKEIPELKNVSDYDERIRLMNDAYSVETSLVRGQKVLLFDDLYRSGATMNSIASLLYDNAGVLDICALTVTRTRRLA
ncbi:MAG: ComF family protein [Candidatus Binataceae bacterium]